MGITQKFTEIKADIQRLSRTVNDKITDLKSDMALDKVEEVKAISEQAKTEIETRKNSALNDITSKTENSIQSIQFSVNETTNSVLEQIEIKKNDDLSEIETTTNDSKTELSEMVSTANTYKENAKTYSEQAKDYAEQAKNIADGNIYATKEDLLANRLPPNTIIQMNDPTLHDDNFKKCDGSKVAYNTYPSLSITNVKFYRLCNLTRSTYDDNGNITFRFFHNDLWTTDPDICKKKNPDLRNLYRRLRYRGDDDLGGATEHDYILSGNLTDYQCFGENYNFINVQEELTMTNGVITSVSEFYDGEYRVELTEYVETQAIAGDSLNYINRYDYKDYNAVADTTQGNTETNKGYYIEGATEQKPHYYFFSGAETDRKISDNQYLTWCVDGKKISFNNGEEGSTTEVDVTHKVITTDYYSSATPCTIIFDFITPPTFVATRDIFHGYRSLIFRIADTTGKLNMYMAGFKSNNALKWRASNVFTGYTLAPNRKYRLVYRCDGYGDSSSHMYHYLDIFQYNETETSFTKLTCDSTGKFGEGHYELNYFPYNYYNSYGMRTMYHTDATAWTKGLFIDLLSLRIQHVEDTTFQNYGNEFRMAKLYYQDPVDNGLALPRITGKDGCESYIKVK